MTYKIPNVTDIIETVIVNDHTTAEIVHDPNCEQPYVDDESVKIVVLHRRYSDPSEGALGTTPEAVEEWIKANPDWFTIPLFLYDHGGVAYRIAGPGGENPFLGRAQHAAWDSGRVGIIALKRSDWGNGNEDDARLVEWAGGVAIEYGMWANGECYGYRVFENGSTLPLDSCWGFVGLDAVKEAIGEALT